MKVKVFIFITTIIVLIFIVRACISNMYHEIGNSFTGNKPSSIGSVDSKYNSELVYEYVDSLYKYYPEYQVPEKYINKLQFKGDGTDYSDIAYFYFNDEPEEIHELQFSGMIYHRCIYKIRDGDLTWIAGEGAQNLGETERILKRIETEIFPRIESLIEKNPE